MNRIGSLVFATATAALTGLGVVAAAGGTLFGPHTLTGNSSSAPAVTGSERVVRASVHRESAEAPAAEAQPAAQSGALSGAASSAAGGFETFAGEGGTPAPSGGGVEAAEIPPPVSSTPETGTSPTAPAATPTAAPAPVKTPVPNFAPPFAPPSGPIATPTAEPPVVVAAAPPAATPAAPVAPVTTPAPPAAPSPALNGADDDDEDEDEHEDEDDGHEDEDEDEDDDD